MQEKKNNVIITKVKYLLGYQMNQINNIDEKFNFILTFFYDTISQQTNKIFQSFFVSFISLAVGAILSAVSRWGWGGSNFQHSANDIPHKVLLVLQFAHRF